MVTSKRRDAIADPSKIQIDECILEKVKSFQYLGSTVTEDVTSLTEVKKRLATGTGQLPKLKRLWTTHIVSTSTKVKLIRLLVTSIALYGRETWKLSNKIEKRLMAYEMHCFRRILRITWKQSHQ